MSRMLHHLLQDESGQDLVEYALLAAFIATVSIVALSLLGQSIEKIFQDLNTVL
ncbi:MAG: Flp family type IVb pilin [Candidatus Eiseniibacteriota bacterium]